MHRIDNETATLTLPATEPDGPNPNSFFSHTALSVAWLNAIQEEVCYVIEQAGFTLDKADQGQLLAAIQQIITDAGVIPPPAGGSGNILNTNGYNILSSTSDITIDAASRDVRISANNFNGVGTILDGGTALHLPTGADILGFYNSTTDYLADSVSWPYITVTQKAIVDAFSHWAHIPQQTLFGAIDTIDIATPYYWNWDSQIGNDMGPLTGSGLPLFPFSFPATASSTFLVQLISMDVWTDVAVPAGGMSLQFWIGTATSGVAGWSCNVASGQTHGQITPSGVFRVSDSTTDHNIGLTSYFSTPVTRISYRIILRSIPL